MERKLWLIMLSVAVCLLFAPVSAGFVNNISATQTITNPTLTTAGGDVNLTIKFSTPNERLSGGIQVNDTSLPAGWDIRPLYYDPTNDDPSVGQYSMNTTSGYSSTWSQGQQAWAWSSPLTLKTAVYEIRYYVTVPPGTSAGTYHVNSYATSSPPAGGTEYAAIPGQTTVTVNPIAPPTVTSAATNAAGNLIIITFDKTMANPAGKHGEFMYKINGGADQAFSGAALNATSATKIDLTPTGTAIAGGDTVTVKYTLGTVLAADGGILATFAGQAVNNCMPSPPTVSSAATNAAGNLIIITFNKNMANPAGKHGEFKYQINGGGDQAFSGAVLNATSATKIDLTPTGTAIATGDTVTVNYTKGTVLAADGGILASFVPQSVNNCMPAPPTFASAATNAAGNLIIITFNKNMANPAGKHGEFKYQINGGGDQAFSGAVLNATSATKIDLTPTGTAIGNGDAVTVNYTKGTVLAADGGILASFVPQSVNNCVPAGPPTFTSAATNVTGKTITITFSKNMANPAGKHGEFKYKINGGADQVFSAAALNATSATKIDLITSGTAIANGNTVTVSYTLGTVLAADGGVLATFAGQSVNNCMPAPPTVASAATNTPGTLITVAFSKNMANPAGKHGEFSYSVNGGGAQAFSAAALNADPTKIDLTPSGTAIAYGNTVTVSYTAGTVLAADYGTLATFAGQSVTNNMPVGVVVSFSSNYTAGRIAPTPILFTDTTSGSPDTWNWSFGDNTWFNTSTLALSNPTYTYAKNGTYTAKLYANNTISSGSYTYPQIIYIGYAPLASFTSDATGGKVTLGSAVAFKNTSLNLANLYTAPQFYWVLGDGTISTVQDASRTYGSIGTYGVNLTVTDQLGTSTASTQYIAVQSAPTTDTNPALPAAVNLTGSTIQLNISNMGGTGSNITGNDIIVLNPGAGIANVQFHTSGVTNSSGNLTGTVTGVTVETTPTTVTIGGFTIPIVLDINAPSYTSGGSAAITVGTSDPTNQSSYNTAIGGGFNESLLTLDVATSGFTGMSGAVVNFSIPHAWTVRNTRITVVWNHGGFVQLSPTLVGTYTSGGTVYDIYHVTTPSFSTLVVAGAGAAPSPYTASSGTGGGGDGGSGSGDNYGGTAATGGTTTGAVSSAGSMVIAKEGQTLQTFTTNTAKDAGVAASVTVPLGTTVRGPDGQVISSVSIAAVNAADVPSVPSGATYSFSGFAVKCSPDGATFSKEASVVFSMTPQQWNTALEKANGNTALMTVMFFDTKSASWMGVPTTVNPTAHTVTASTTHFTVFGLFIDQTGTTPVVMETPTPGEVPTTRAPTIAPVKTTVAPSATPAPGGAMPWTFIIGVIVIIVIVGGAGYYFMTKKKNL